MYDESRPAYGRTASSRDSSRISFNPAPRRIVSDIDGPPPFRE